jgi:hypothetical protein
MRLLRTLALAASAASAGAFHDCVQPKTKEWPYSGAVEPATRSLFRAPGGAAAVAAARRGDPAPLEALRARAPPAGCGGGLCVGMHGGPHEGGPASYPAGSAATGWTSLYATMRVPALPMNESGICYYLWTDLFMGDMSWGRMNQFVPQLILGDALDGSSGPPDYVPHYGHHSTWSFGAHYFFEIFDGQNVDAKAAYGELFPAAEGETLFTSFVASAGPFGPSWTLEMGVVGDATRLSRVIVDQPYMGLGAEWPVPSVSWSELNFTNVCINSCWEIYGGIDADHLPSSGTLYEMKVTQGAGQSYPFVEQWDRDEGASTCFADAIAESHSQREQHVYWSIEL